MKKGPFKTKQDANPFLDNPEKFLADLSRKSDVDNRLADELAQRMADVHGAIKALDLATDENSKKMRADAVRQLQDIGRQYDGLRKRHAEYVSTLRNLYESNWIETRNPIFVWLALTLLENKPMPEWCLNYIRQCAREISKLAHNRALDPKSCAKTKVASALGLTRLGWNAFHHYRNLSESTGLLAQYKSLLGEGVSTRSATTAILSHHGIEDDRSLRRRLAAVKKAYGHMRRS